MKKLHNFLKSLLKYIKSGFKNVSQNTYNSRMYVCSNCSYFGEFVCSECSCLVHIKAKMSTEKCPLDKW